MKDSLWNREKGVGVPLGVAALGQFLVLLEREWPSLNIWVTFAVHGSPAALMWLGTWFRFAEWLGLFLLATLTGWTFYHATDGNMGGVICASAAIPVLMAALLPAASWVRWTRRFSWQALGILFMGFGWIAREERPSLASDGYGILVFALALAGWNYIDGRKDWSFQRQRRLTHLILLPFALLLSFGSLSEKVTHGIQLRYLGYLVIPVATLGIFGFDPFGPTPPREEEGD